MKSGGRGTRTPKRLRAAVFKTAALPVRTSPPGTVNNNCQLLIAVFLAEREGFEPSVAVLAATLA